MELTLNENIWVVSDLHINHRKLCTDYEDHFERTRKYKTVDEMNDDIVASWNSNVTDDDTVIFLGDFTLGTPHRMLVDTFKHYYDILKFKHMFMIRGNHDYALFKHLYPHMEEKGRFSRITLVHDYIMLENNGKSYLFQHFNYDTELNPHDGTPGNPEILVRYMQDGRKPDYLVHGHTHEFERARVVKTEFGDMIENNVSWEAWYRPVRLDELKEVSRDV